MAQAKRLDQIVITLERNEATSLWALLKLALERDAGELPGWNLQTEAADALADVLDTLKDVLEAPF